MEGIAYGGDWNPEQWDRETNLRDIERMVEAGVTLISLGIFSWASLEPEEGHYDLDWLADLIDQLHNAGIAIPHATPEENVLRSGIAVVKLLSPVDFHSMENPEDTVAANLVLFLALKDQQLHLEILKKLFLSLQKPELVQKLIDSRDGKSLLEVLQKI